MKNFENHSEDILTHYDVISFDIFDTLIKRIVPKPVDVFTFVEDRFHEKNKDILVNDYKRKRVHAERTARNIAHDEEITLDEIYRRLEPIYGKAVSDKLKLVEIDCEKEVCIPNPSIITFYKECVQRKKRIYLISDMYLPESVVIDILSNAGIDDYNHLYLSSSILKTKSTGSLFQYVKESEGLDTASWCHLGDNPNSDSKVPEKMGISTYHVTEKKERFSLKSKSHIAPQNNVYNMSLARYAQLGSLMYTDSYEAVGYRLYGPLLFQFIIWLRGEFVGNQINNVLFCARDGYYFQKAYQKLYPDDDTRKSIYFYVSRKSLIYPLLSSILCRGERIDEFFSIMWINILPRKFTVKDLIDKFKFTFSEEDLKPYTTESVLSRDTVLHDCTFKTFFMKLIKKNQKEILKEGEAFLTYIKNLRFEGSKTAIVDLGWHGSTQAVLEKILDKSLWGYYLSFCNDTLHFEHAKGYLANNLQENDSISLISTLLEVVFSAPHGSLRKYQLDIDKVRFICESYEHINDADKVEKIRKGMMQFIDNIYHNTFFKNNQKYLSKESELISVGLNPSKSFLELMKEIQFVDDRLKPLLKKNTFLYYLAHPKAFLRDLKESPWKVGFLTYNLGTSRGIAPMYIFLKRIKRWLR